MKSPAHPRWEKSSAPHPANPSASSEASANPRATHLSSRETNSPALAHPLLAPSPLLPWHHPSSHVQSAARRREVFRESPESVKPNPSPCPNSPPAPSTAR